VRWDPEVFLPDGRIADPRTERFLRAFMAEFRDHVQRVLTVLPRP
jgi:chromate reductase